MTSSELFEQIRRKRSFLCVGLDTDPNKIPQRLLSEDDPVFAFNRAIVDATAAYAVCYKPNLAFTRKTARKAGKVSSKRCDISGITIPKS